MTKQQKQELKQDVIQCGRLGYTRTETVKMLYKPYHYSKDTIRNYWDAFNPGDKNETKKAD